jgi:hypothetical protein
MTLTAQELTALQIGESCAAPGGDQCTKTFVMRVEQVDKLTGATK